MSQSVEEELAVGPRPTRHDGPLRLQRKPMGIVRRPRHDKIQIGIRRAQRSRRRHDMGLGSGRF